MKELKVSSALLSSFYKRATTIDAAVILPAEYYNEPDRSFPVVYRISGYGGDYHNYSGKETTGIKIDSFPCITVFLDGNCPTGNSTYANSMNNGPWGDALVTEMIPFMEKKYRCNGARFLAGYSSGGRTVLCLQINYPKTFAGCWSSSPDPIDFRNFQEVNIYEDKNKNYDKDSNVRIDGSIGGSIPWTYLIDDYRIENVLYRGEQYGLWNAVFGRQQKNGMPESICDVNTGSIVTIVAAHWKVYDISLLLRNHWQDLKTGIDNKIRISVGTSDNFFLDKSVKGLEEDMKKLNSKFEVAYYPGDHFTVNTVDYKTDGYRFLATKYTQWIAQHLKTTPLHPGSP